MYAKGGHKFGGIPKWNMLQSNLSIECWSWAVRGGARDGKDEQRDVEGAVKAPPLRLFQSFELQLLLEDALSNFLMLRVESHHTVPRFGSLFRNSFDLSGSGLES